MHPILSLLILDERLRTRRYQAALLLFALILAAGSVPGARAEIGQFATGIVLHSAAYGIITFLLYTGTAGTRRYRALRSVLTVMLMGAIDETVQTLVPFRRGALMDWMVDTGAALICASLLARFLPEPVPHPQP